VRNVRARLERSAPFARWKEVAAENIARLLEANPSPWERLCIEGNNQKQADFLAKSLVKAGAGY
jgi:malonate decarboxylase alpha subunit